MADPLIVPIVDEGLGNSAYLVDLGDGRALAVDAPLDLRAVRSTAKRHGLAVAFAADTHLHADFLSGAVQLAADDGEQVLAVFTGGSLLVGAAARTDLSGQDRTEQLARSQFASLRRLLTLPDATLVYPTHGVGSFCSAPPGAQ